MRTLFVTTNLPDGPAARCGIFQRQELLLEAARSFGAVDALFFAAAANVSDDAAERQAERQLAGRPGLALRPHVCRSDGWLLSRRQRLLGVIRFLAQPRIRPTCKERQAQSLRRRIDAGVDLIIARGIRSAAPLLRLPGELPPVFFDLNDIYHVKLFREARRGAAGPLGYAYLPAALRGERRLARLARRTFVCSEVDRAYLAARWRLPRIAVVPNAVDVVEPLGASEASTLLFLGSMGYSPNADAARFLARSIWPRVRAVRPEAKLILAGPQSERMREELGDVPGLDIRGFVDSLDSLYTETAVACAPIRSGSGTRIKILEAAAYARPIVSTRLGAEGLDFADGRDILIHDDPRGFAEACARLLASGSERRRLGRAARQLVVDRYQRQGAVEAVRREIRSGLAEL